MVKNTCLQGNFIALYQKIRENIKFYEIGHNFLACVYEDCPPSSVYNSHEFERGPKAFGVLCPPQLMFYCNFKKEFSEFSEIWSFMSGDFFRKIPQNFRKISRNFLNFPKIERKPIISVPKLVQNHYIDQNLAKFSHKTARNSRKFGVLCPKNAISVPTIMVRIPAFGPDPDFFGTIGPDLVRNLIPKSGLGPENLFLPSSPAGLPSS